MKRKLASKNSRRRNQEFENKNQGLEFDKCTVLSTQQLTMCSQEEFEKHKYVKHNKPYKVSYFSEIFTLKLAVSKLTKSIIPKVK